VKRLTAVILLILLVAGFVYAVIKGPPGTGTQDANTVAASESTVRVMTFNIRYDNPGDGDDAWPNRKDFAASMILFHKADIVGVQEALRHQVDELAAWLPGFNWFGIGRDDGVDAGEFMAVFYRPERFDLLEQDTFWLSETPDKPGIGWDAACNRVVTWAHFRDTVDGCEFYHFNTHFDHMGPAARRESALLLLDRIAVIAGDAPVTVTGDFNAKPGDEPIRILLDGTSGDPALRLFDTRAHSKYPHHGPSGTWSGFTSPGSPGDEPIDYVFFKNAVTVVYHGTLSDTFDGRFPSDHMPVLAEVSYGQSEN